MNHPDLSPSQNSPQRRRHFKAAAALLMHFLTALDVFLSSINRS
jgi:hypothetical protein